MEVRVPPGAFSILMPSKATSQKSSNKKFLPKPSVKNDKYSLPFEESPFFTKMINHIGDELMLIDDKARIVFVNDATIHNIGYSRRYILSKNITDFFKEKVSISTWRKNYFMELKRKRRPLKYEVQRVKKGGKVQTVDITAFYMPYKGKEFILSVARDITKQVDMQKEMKKSEDLYRLISECAGDGIITVDLQGRLMYINRAQKKLINVSLKQGKGHHYSEFVTPDTVSKFDAAFALAKRGVAQIHEEIVLIHKNGSHISVEINVSPLYRAGKIISVNAIIRDIRNRKRFENVIRESEKMKAMQLFASGTAQEMNHPLQAVLLSTQSLIKKYKNREYEYVGYKEYLELVRKLEIINERIRYCCDTTDRLTRLHRKRVGIKAAHCAPGIVIRKILRLKSYQTKEADIYFKLKVGSSLPSINMGEIEFQHVMENIFNNAIQSMTNGGVISIKTSFRKLTQRVKIEVADQGIGIAKEDLEHVFEPFFTTKQRGVEKNSGLGLPIVYALIKACQGDVSVKSSLRKGTVIIVSLPVYKR